MKRQDVALSLRMGLRLLWRELRAGELTVLLFALLVAVAAMSSVALFSDRIDSALTRQASQLLAADLVVNSRSVPPDTWQQQAAANTLRSARSASFPSMVFAREQATLVNLKPSAMATRCVAKCSCAAAMACVMAPCARHAEKSGRMRGCCKSWGCSWATRCVSASAASG